MTVAAARRPVDARRRWLLLLLVGAAVLILGAQIVVIGPRAISRILVQIDGVWACLALLAIVIGGVIGGINSWVLVAQPEGVPIGKFLAHYWTGWAVGQVAPGQIGDTLTISALLKGHNIPLKRSLAGLGIDKVLSLLVSLAAVCALPLILVGMHASWITLSVLLLSVVLALVMPQLGRIEQRLRLAIRYHKVREALEMVGNAGRLVDERPLAVAANLLVSVVKLGVTGFAFWCGLRAVQLPLPLNELPAITVCAASAGLIAYLPLSLNGIGTVEATGIVLFGALGLPPAAVLAAYLLLRCATLLAAWGPAAGIHLAAYFTAAKLHRES